VSALLVVGVKLTREVDSQQRTSFFAWAFFIDFQKRELEVWDKELLDKVSFENLKELGWKYMERIQETGETEYK
jgi:hypothetical protein